MADDSSDLRDGASRSMSAGIARLMQPRSVAIVGASDKPGALGATVLANLDRAGFPGAVHLVNPKRAEIGGRSCIASVDDLPEGVDVAILAIPRVGVLDAICGLARRNVGAAVIFSAGFAEEGEQGLADQQEIGRIARESGMVIEGPNCLGLVNFRDRVPLTFIRLPEARVTSDDCVGIVSQSGAMAAVLATTMITRDVPLSCYVSTGNEAASGVEDYLDYLVGDPHTRVIGMIVEQFRQPRRFLAAARAARDAGKQIVLLHPGRSDAGAASAATHTGAMAGDYAVMCVHARHAGVTIAETLEELGDIVEIAARCRALPQPALAVVGESGALKAMTLDLCEELGLALAALGNDDSPALRAVLPDFVPVSNPLDITAQGLVDPSLYGRTLAALAGDDRVKTILIMLIQTEENSAHVKFDAVATAVRDLRTDKPVIVAGVDEGGGVAAADIAALRALGIVYLPTTERALRAIARAAASTTDGAAWAEVAPLAGLPLGGTVAEYRAKELLGPRGIAFPAGEMATSLEAAQEVAARLGYPVVLKAQSPDLAHKSDAGGVIVGLDDPEALAAGWTRLHANIAAARPGMILDGVLVEAMGERGIELIVGARNDPAWGPVILLGFGGVAAELLHDVCLLPPGLSQEEILRALRGLKMAPLLEGFRGAPRMDLAAVADIVAALGDIVAATPAIREVDLNPVIVYPEGQGVIALDALITL